MNVKLLLAATAAAVTLTALPASAQYYGYRYHNDYYGGYRPQTITVRENGRQFTVDRGDRLYWELRAGPYHFKDGHVYTYTNRCGYAGGECLVRVYDPYSRNMPYNTTTAPPVGYVSYYDNRYNYDRDYDDD